MTMCRWSVRHAKNYAHWIYDFVRGEKKLHQIEWMYTNAGSARKRSGKSREFISLNMIQRWKSLWNRYVWSQKPLRSQSNRTRFSFTQNEQNYYFICFDSERDGRVFRLFRIYVLAMALIHSQHAIREYSKTEAIRIFEFSKFHFFVLFLISSAFGDR